MSIVRRTAYATGILPEIDENKMNIMPSRQTILKSESIKKHLEDHFAHLIQETDFRQFRHRNIHRKIKRNKIPPEERDLLMEQFYKEESNYCRLQRTRFKPSRYERIKLIGRGGYGEVWLVREKGTGSIFAMKILSKSDIILTNQIFNVRSERDALSSIDNPWIVRLNCSFQDTSYLYLIMEYVPGGDLMGALIKVNKFSESVSAFFFAEMVLAVDSVHRMGFVHRDLKPDNFLITQNGHLKLTDFGLATNYTKVDNKLAHILDEIVDEMRTQPGGYRNQVSHQRNLVGTCDYMAPEILSGFPPSPASDYWSLGVILFEMLFAYPPFTSESQQLTAYKVVAWKKALVIPTNAMVSPQALDMIRHLICNQNDRYGFEKIVNHPFCKGFDFKNPHNNVSKMIPKIRSPIDTSYFEEFEPKFSDIPANHPISDLEKLAFLAYSYKRKPESSINIRASDLFEEEESEND